MSLIEQAAKRLEQLRQAGVELPDDKARPRCRRKRRLKKPSSLQQGACLRFWRARPAPDRSRAALHYCPIQDQAGGS